MSLSFLERRKVRHFRIRKRLIGTPERPRLVVRRSQKHLHAQLIDDYARKTILSFSTTGEKFRKALGEGRTLKAAKKLGELFGPELVSKGIKKVVFDRGGYQYHGRVKALAEALRSAGLDF